MGVFLNKTDQELADLIRQNLNQVLPQEGYFAALKNQAKQALRYQRECRLRGTNILTLLANNPEV